MADISKIVRIGNQDSREAGQRTAELHDYLSILGVGFGCELAGSPEGIGLRIDGSFVPYRDYKLPIVLGMISDAKERTASSALIGIDGAG